MRPIVQLDPIHLPEGPEPDDIGTGHRMRAVTETVAADAGEWTPGLAGEVRGFFDEMAAEWSADRPTHAGPLDDALDRGVARLHPGRGASAVAGSVLELGAGTGAATRLLDDRGFDVVAGDLSFEMLARLSGDWGHRVQLDGARLPFPDRRFAMVVCVNMLLFAAELRRVIAPGGLLVWVNGIGERTPIHLGAETLAESLGDGVDVVASRSGWGTWAVARLP